MGVYYKQSTDGGTNWSSASENLSPGIVDDHKTLRGNLLSTERLYVVWHNDDLNYIMGNTLFDILNSAPTAPTVLYVNMTVNTAQSGVANPVAVGDGRPVFSAIYNDPDVDSAVKYEIIVYNVAGCASGQVWDSGAGGTGMAPCTTGNRCEDISYGETSPLSFDGTKYYWKMRYWDYAETAGEFSDCSDNFTILGPSDQMRHGDFFFNKTSKEFFTW